MTDMPAPKPDTSQDATPATPTPTPADAAATLGITNPAQGPDTGTTAETDWKAESRKWEDRSKKNRADLTRLQTQLDTFKGAIGPALGLDKAPDDPKQLAEQLAAAQRNTDATKREMQILKLAATNGANPDLLTDSASFQQAIAGIAPDDTDQLAAAIKKAVADHPHFAVQPQQAAGAGWRDTNAGTITPPDADAEALRILGLAT